MVWYTPEKPIGWNVEILRLESRQLHSLAAGALRMTRLCPAGIVSAVETKQVCVPRCAQRAAAIRTSSLQPTILPGVWLTQALLRQSHPKTHLSLLHPQRGLSRSKEASVLFHAWKLFGFRDCLLAIYRFLMSSYLGMSLKDFIALWSNLPKILSTVKLNGYCSGRSWTLTMTSKCNRRFGFCLVQI